MLLSHKPRIRKVWRGWQCQTPDACGFAQTPSTAYEDWYLRHKYVVTAKAHAEEMGYEVPWITWDLGCFECYVIPK